MQTSWTKNSVSLNYRYSRHVCWNSKCRLLLIVCRPRKTNFCCPFPFAANKRKFTVSVFRIYIYIHIHKYINVHTHIHIHIQYTHMHIYIYTYHIYTHIYVCICAAVSNGKRKPRRFSFIRLMFAHRSNGSLSFVCLLSKNQTEDVCLTMG